MNKLSEEDLILYHYGELTEAGMSAIKASLMTDSQLAEQYQELVELLGVTKQWQPEKIDDNFESEMWQKITPELNVIDNTRQPVETSHSLWSKFSDWMLDIAHHPAPVFALVVVLISVAYFTGRHDQQQDIIDNPTELVASLSIEIRNKILFQSVTMHLESSSRLLTSVSIDSQSQSEIAATEQKWAKQLLASNRLFSKAAEQSGQWRIVSLLNELEPILIEMSTSPEQSFSSREQIQQRIKSRSLVFKTKAFKANQSKSI